MPNNILPKLKKSLNNKKKHHYKLDGSTRSRRLAINLIRYQSVSSSNSFKANLYIDVKDYLAIKKKSLKFHKSQQFHEYFSDKYIESFHNNFFAYSRGIKISETFFEEIKFL